MEHYKSVLADVSHEHRFFLKDGKVLKSLKELAQALETMSDETFKHHVNSEKNDFANWIRDVIKDEKLAHKMIRINDRRGAYKTVQERISKLESSKKSGLIQKFRKTGEGEKQLGFKTKLSLPWQGAPKPSFFKKTSGTSEAKDVPPKRNIFKHFLLGVIIGSCVVMLFYLAYRLIIII